MKIFLDQDFRTQNRSPVSSFLHLQLTNPFLHFSFQQITSSKV